MLEIIRKVIAICYNTFAYCKRQKFGRTLVRQITFETGWQKKNWQIYCITNNKQYKKGNWQIKVQHISLITKIAKLKSFKLLSFTVLDSYSVA